MKTYEEGQPGALALGSGSVVDLRKLEDAISYIEAVNRLPLAEITWTRDNVRVPVTTEQIDEWLFTGLNNRDFAREHLLPNAEITDGYRRPTAPNPPKSERR